MQLVDGIGRERVFVSVYGGPRGALKELERMLGEVEKRIVSEEEEGLDMGGMQRTVLPTGEKRVKRIAWLAEVRNKLLEPLYSVLDSGSGFMSTSTGASKKSKLELNPNPNFNSTSRFLSKDGTHLTFSKLLFINDVYFTPSDALRLLWGTNLDSNGVARYKAVCAADFVSSWKFYDTFATRDVEGYSIGVPIYPWFANEGEARSRRDVLEGRDSVRVRSCWGGMVAFEGGYFMGRGEGGEGVNADGGFSLYQIFGIMRISSFLFESNVEGTRCVPWKLYLISSQSIVAPRDGSKGVKFHQASIADSKSSPPHSTERTERPKRQQRRK